MRNIAYCSLLESELGTILITANASQLLGVHFTEQHYIENENTITRQVKQELKEYLQGNRFYFSYYHFDLQGFQAKVLAVVASIPYGKCLTYKQIAKKIGNPTSYRAVANALAQNPYLILIPCHRVIGSDRKLHGYQGGIQRKRKLLLLEKNVKKEIIEEKTYIQIENK